jgi:hypothetical protein
MVRELRKSIFNVINISLEVEYMAQISKQNKRYREKDTMISDLVGVLNSDLSYGTKYAVLFEILWIWTEFDGKYMGCRYWSNEALKQLDSSTNVKLIHDHAVPRKIIIDKIFGINSPTENDVRQIFDKYLNGVIITKDEDKQLNANGYRQKMPSEFQDRNQSDYDNSWLRYKKVGIKVVQVQWEDEKILLTDSVEY